LFLCFFVSLTIIYLIFFWIVKSNFHVVEDPSPSQNTSFQILEVTLLISFFLSSFPFLLFFFGFFGYLFFYFFFFWILLLFIFFSQFKIWRHRIFVLQIQNLKTQNHFYSQFKKSENKEYNLFIIKTSENKEYFLFTIKNVKTYFFKTEILLQKLKRTTIYKVWIPCPNSKSRNMILFF